MKAKTFIIFLIIPLLIWWFYNLNNFNIILKNPNNRSNNFQSIQQNLIKASNSMKNAMFIAIPLIAIGFIGYQIYLDRTRIFNTIPFDKLNRHLIILGSTGAGKTTMAKKIIKKVMRRVNKPIYIFDMHGEYNDLSINEKEKIETIKFDEKTSFNIFDPWTIPAKRYIVFLVNTLKDILELSEPQAYILLRALEEEYQERGYFEKNRKELPVPPDINDVIERIQKLQPRSRFDYEVKVALE
jgi:molybdopterin-guanine dinucleotide biosynthesis protein